LLCYRFFFFLYLSGKTQELGVLVKTAPQQNVICSMTGRHIYLCFFFFLVFFFFFFFNHCSLANLSGKQGVEPAATIIESTNSIKKFNYFCLRFFFSLFAIFVEKFVQQTRLQEKTKTKTME